MKRSKTIEQVVNVRGREELFRTIFESAEDCIFMKDKFGRYAKINPAMEKLFGRPASEIIGITDRDLFGDEAGIYIEQMDQRVLSGEVIKHEHTKPVGGVPRTFHVIKVPIRATSGKVMGLCGIARDISERKRAEEELIRKEEKYRSIFENILDVYFETTLDGTILELSPSIEKVMNYNQDEVKKKSAYDIYVDKAGRDRLIQELEKAGRVSDFEISLKDRDGNPMLCSITAKIAYDGRGDPIKIIGSLRNISERKKAEEKIRAAREGLRSLTGELIMTEARERQQIAAILHDNIAQSLAMAKIKLQSAIEYTQKSELNPLLNEIHLSISEAIHQTRSLITDLSPPVLNELGFDAAVEWLADEIQAKHGLEIVCKKGGQCAALDKEIKIFLFQAIRELLINVVKHANANQAEVCTLFERKEVRIIVCDNGTGFSASEIESPHARKERGFGLFNIRERLDFLGGCLNIQSERGQGTEVTMVAPIKSKPKKKKRFI